MRAGAKIDHAGILRAKRRPPACSDYLGAALELIRTGEANGGQIRIEDGCLVIAPDEVAKASARTRSHLMLVAGASAVRRHDRGAVAHQHWRAGALDAGRMVRGGAACSCEAVDRGAVCHAAIGRILGEVSAGTGSSPFLVKISKAAPASASNIIDKSCRGTSGINSTGTRLNPIPFNLIKVRESLSLRS